MADNMICVDSDRQGSVRGRIGADLITLESMLRMPVSVHNLQSLL